MDAPTYWHALAYNDGDKPHLAHGDHREVRLNQPLKVNMPIVIYKRGLHFATELITAIKYCPIDRSNVKLCKVTVGFVYERSEAIGVTDTRTVVEWKNGTAVMRKWAQVVESLVLPEFRDPDNNNARSIGEQLAYLEKYAKYVREARAGQSQHVASWGWSFTSGLIQAASFYYWYNSGTNSERKETFLAFLSKANAKLVECYEETTARDK